MYHDSAHNVQSSRPSLSMRYAELASNSQVIVYNCACVMACLRPPYIHPSFSVKDG